MQEPVKIHIFKRLIVVFRFLTALKLGGALFLDLQNGETCVDVKVIIHRSRGEKFSWKRI